jgi:hypothetical protein
MGGRQRTSLFFTGEEERKAEEKRVERSGGKK